MDCRQFRALLWKNLLAKRRRKCFTLCDYIVGFLVSVKYLLLMGDALGRPLSMQTSSLAATTTLLVSRSSFTSSLSNSSTTSLLRKRPSSSRLSRPWACTKSPMPSPGFSQNSFASVGPLSPSGSAPCYRSLLIQPALLRTLVSVPRCVSAPPHPPPSLLRTCAQHLLW